MSEYREVMFLVSVAWAMHFDVLDVHTVDCLHSNQEKKLLFLPIL
jgi:hypothetical protein